MRKAPMDSVSGAPGNQLRLGLNNVFIGCENASFCSDFIVPQGI